MLTKAFISQGNRHLTVTYSVLAAYWQLVARRIGLNNLTLKIHWRSELLGFVNNASISVQSKFLLAGISHGNIYPNVTYFLLATDWRLIAGHIAPSDLILKPCWHNQ
jgi:hypothetical protein